MANKNKVTEYVAGGLAGLIIAGGVSAVAGAAVAAHEIRQEARVAADHGNIGQVALLNEALADKREDAVGLALKAGALLLVESVAVTGVVGRPRRRDEETQPVQSDEMPATQLQHVMVMDNFYNELARDKARPLQTV